MFNDYNVFQSLKSFPAFHIEFREDLFSYPSFLKMNILEKPHKIALNMYFLENSSIQAHFLQRPSRQYTPWKILTIFLHEILFGEKIQEQIWNFDLVRNVIFINESKEKET